MKHEKETNPPYAKMIGLLEKAIQKNVHAEKTFGIAFSGGLDSGIIGFLAQKKFKQCILFTVGLPGSSDLARAEKLAKKWNVKWKTKTLSPEEVEKYYRLAKKIVGGDHLQLTLGTVNLAIAELVKENKVDTLLVGSGADELFCGYAAFDACREAPIECENLRKEKVDNVASHDVAREIACGKHFHVSIVAPYLDKDFSAEAMRIPAAFNLQGKYGPLRKNALRVLGEKAGVPLEIIREPKKAMQYGSGVNKVLLKTLSKKLTQKK